MSPLTSPPESLSRQHTTIPVCQTPSRSPMVLGVAEPGHFWYLHRAMSSDAAVDQTPGATLETKKGTAAGLVAYLLWGLLPVYWKALGGVPAPEILGHRIFWSMVLLLPLLLARSGWENIRLSWFRPGVLRVFVPSAVLLGANWFTYIYAVNSGRILESSLGYFLTPLVNILLGRVFLGETLRPAQVGAVLLAGIGVGWMVLQAAHFPGLALFLAVTFALYGLLRKIAPLGSLDGLALETLILGPPALAYLLYLGWQGIGVFGSASVGRHLLLIGSGAATSLPLLFFAVAARRISLTALGFMLYISPSLQFLLGWGWYGEPLSVERLIGFVCIWIALALFSLDSLLASGKRTPPVASGSGSGQTPADSGSVVP